MKNRPISQNKTARPEPEEQSKPCQYYCLDNSGMTHFGATAEEAQFKAASSNRDMNFKLEKEGF